MWFGLLRGACAKVFGYSLEFSLGKCNGFCFMLSGRYSEPSTVFPKPSGHSLFLAIVNFLQSKSLQNSKFHVSQIG